MEMVLHGFGHPAYKSRSHYIELIESLYRVIPQRMMKEQFELSDTNEDGFVTWAEHLKSTFDVDDPENIKLSLEGTYDHKKRTLSVSSFRTIKK